MNIKSIVTIEVEKDGNTFQFSMPFGSSYGTAYNAAFEILQQVIELSKQAADRIKPVELNEES